MMTVERTLVLEPSMWRETAGRRRRSVSRRVVQGERRRGRQQPPRRDSLSRAGGGVGGGPVCYPCLRDEIRARLGRLLR